MNEERIKKLVKASLQTFLPLKERKKKKNKDEEKKMKK